jgi:site-specific recombinase XerD
MTALRQRLIEEITLRGYSPKTTEAYVHAVAELARYYHRAPDGLTDSEVRAYLLHLHLKTAKAASTLNVAVSGLRFFYQRVLNRPFTHLERNLPRPRQAKRRPKAYTVAEVKRLLDRGCVSPKHRAFLMTVYGAGLRLNEACHLRPEHLDRSAGQIRVEQGKGRKDRYTVLPERLLRELEAYWKRYHPQGGWLFPSTRNPQEPMPDGTGQKIFYQAVARAGLPDKGGIHCLRHSFATHWMEAGLPLFVLKRLLGHTSLSTTSKYLHVSREYLAKIKSPLDQSADPALPAAPPSAAPSPEPYPAGRSPRLAGVVSPFDELPTH